MTSFLAHGSRRRRGAVVAGKPVKRSKFDRVTALGVGMLIGLSAVFADRYAGRIALPFRKVERAESPTDLSGRSWKAVLKRTISEFNEDRIPAVAAGSAFFALLALFPALGVFVSLYGLIGDLHGARDSISALQGLLPEGGVKVLNEQIERLAAAPHASLGFAFASSLILSVWSSNAGMKALIAGLNIAYEAKERRSFIKLNLVSLAFTAGAILFTVAGVAVIVAVPDVLARLGLQTLQGLSVLRWPVMLVVTAGVLSVLYRYAPSRREARWRWITPGGVLAAVGWMAMSLAFSTYVGHFGHYDRTYGSLGAVVGFMTWIWLSLIVVLLGAELNCELEEQVAADRGN